MPPPFAPVHPPDPSHLPAFHFATGHPQMLATPPHMVFDFNMHLALLNAHYASVAHAMNPFAFNAYGGVHPISSPYMNFGHLVQQVDPNQGFHAGYGATAPHVIDPHQVAVDPTSMAMSAQPTSSAMSDHLSGITTPALVSTPVSKPRVSGQKRRAVDPSDDPQSSASSSSSRPRWMRPAKKAKDSPEAVAAKQKFEGVFGTSVTTPELYGKLQQMARDHRQNPRTSMAPTEAEAFVTAMADPLFAGLVHDKIRVRSGKENANDPRGAGLDELFRTSNTLEWFRRSAGMDQRYAATSNITVAGRTEEVDWLDLQRRVRVGTDTVAFKDGQGHVGALWRFLTGQKGGQYASQDAFHDQRNARILQTTSPAEALQKALLAHIELTGSQLELEVQLSKNALFDVKGHNSTVPSEREAMINRFSTIRDYLAIAFLHAGGDERELPSGARRFGPVQRNPTMAENSIFQIIPQSKSFNL